ncbi:MAG: GAF domain-containing protein [Flavobacteriales bacterium]|nr:GAF domain-containing protein [Flavobacteriales bacterium]
MAEEIIISNHLTKEEKYKQLLPQIASLIEHEPDLIANLANCCAALHFTFNFWWTGFYLVKNNELVLGPFQGPIACTRIKKGKGVCGAAWENSKTLIVPDVNSFPGHISCSSESKSEIVVPFYDENQQVAAVLDIDSNQYSNFDQTDAKYLENICTLFRFRF